MLLYVKESLLHTFVCTYASGDVCSGCINIHQTTFKYIRLNNVCINNSLLFQHTSIYLFTILTYNYQLVNCFLSRVSNLQKMCVHVSYVKKLFASASSWASCAYVRELFK